MSDHQFDLLVSPEGLAHSTGIESADLCEAYENGLIPGVRLGTGMLFNLGAVRAALLMQATLPCRRAGEMFVKQHAGADVK